MSCTACPHLWGYFINMLAFVLLICEGHAQGAERGASVPAEHDAETSPPRRDI